MPPHAGDDWGQDAVLDDLMAAFGPGPDDDPPDDGFGPGLDEFLDGFGPGLDETPLNENADPVPVNESVDQVPESMDAGFLPRGGTGRPALRNLAHGGCGAGFTSGAELDTALPGPALAGFADDAARSDRSYAGLNDDQLIGTLLGWQKTEAWAASGKLSAVAELIRRRPYDAALGSGPDGAPTVWGKFCADELAVAVASSQRAAERMLGVAYDLAFRLPGTSRALREGRIDSYKAQIISEVTRVLDDAGAAAAEALILADIAGKTPGQIRVMIGRAVLQVDPHAARQRREQAQRDARVDLWREDAGTAALCGFGLPPDEALAADQMISSRARELKAAGMAGTMDKLRVRAYLDILLGQDSSPVLPGQECPGRVNTEATRGSKARGPASDSADDPAGPGGAADKPSDGSDLTGPGAGHRTDGGAGYGTGHGPGEPAGPGPGNQTSRSPAESAGPGPGHQAGRSPGKSAGMAARINLTVPLATLLGLAERPGEAGGFGPIDPDLARAMADSAATHPATTWCLTVTDSQGHPTAHGCARPTRRAGSRQPGGRAGPGPRPAARSPGGADRSGAPCGPGGPSGAGPNAGPGPRPDPRLPGGADRNGGPGPSGAGLSGAGLSGAGLSGAGPSGAGLNGAGPNGELGGYRTWRLRPVPGGPDLTIDLESLAVTDCDHRHQTAAHDPSDRLRHLVHIRDGECTWPPCRRAAGRCDFEHAIPWEAGGVTCACNAGPRCRHHHHQKQAPGWRLEQLQPGYHTWTTPSGRRYTTGPTTYPI